MATIHAFERGHNDDSVYAPVQDLIDISTLRVEEGLVIHTCENDRIDFLGKFAIRRVLSPMHQGVTAMSRNSNCLENIRCPQCGNTSRFKIVALVTADVTDDGAEFHGDAAWSDTSNITCPKCDRSGKVADFRCRTFNVHIYREMRFRFDGIRASSHESAAKLAELMPASKASDIDDCDGESLSALVDVAGDEDSGQSRSIDFEAGRKLKIHDALVDALLNIKRMAGKSGDEETDPFALLDLIADEARAAINNATQE